MKQIVIFLLLLFWGSILFGQPTATLEKKVEEQENTIRKLHEEVQKLKKNKTEQKEFKVSIGASFDFNQGISATDLYYDLCFQDYHIWPTTQTEKEKRKWGLDFKLYQSLLFSTPADTSNTLNFPNSQIQELTPNTLLIGDVMLNRIEKLKFIDYGLIIRPTFRLSKTFFAFGHSEVLFRRTDRNVKFVNLDTLNLREVNISDPINIQKSLPRERREEYLDATLFLGLGIVANINVIDSVYFRIKPSVGISTVILGSNFSRAEEADLQCYYLIDVEIIERKSGIKLGIYVRDNNISNNDNILDEPRFALFLSKQFSLNKLAEFLKS